MKAGGFGPSLGPVVVAVALVVGSIVYGWGPLATPAEPAAQGQTPPARVQVAASAAPAAVAEAPALAPAASAPAPRLAARAQEADGDPSPDLTVYLNPGERPTMNEVIDRLHRAGVTTGVAAFNPPGTKPPLVGLAVPDDFVLPPGYVKHHQTTDDGQDIEPILMYAPEHPRFLNAPTRDRVVPSEQAPPGLPLRRVVIPAPTDGRP